MIRETIGTWRGYIRDARRRARQDVVHQQQAQIDRLQAENAKLRNEICVLTDDLLQLKGAYSKVVYDRLQDWQLGRPEMAVVDQ